MTVVTGERQILLSQLRQVPGWRVLQLSENRAKFPWTSFFKMFRQFSVLHEKISSGKSLISELLSPYFMGLFFKRNIFIKKWAIRGEQTPSHFPSCYDPNNKVSIWKQHLSTFVSHTACYEVLKFLRELPLTSSTFSAQLYVFRYLRQKANKDKAVSLSTNTTRLSVGSPTGPTLGLMK